MRRAGLGDAPRTLIEEFAKIKSGDVVLPTQMADRDTAWRRPTPAEAMEAEVAGWIEQHTSINGDRGGQQVVRDGHHPTRTLVSGVEPIEVK